MFKVAHYRRLPCSFQFFDLANVDPINPAHQKACLTSKSANLRLQYSQLARSTWVCGVGGVSTCSNSLQLSVMGIFTVPPPDNAPVLPGYRPRCHPSELHRLPVIACEPTRARPSVSRPWPAAWLVATARRRDS